MRFGSEDSERGIMSGREKEWEREAGRGAQMRPLQKELVLALILACLVTLNSSIETIYLVHRIIKAIFSVVTSSAAMMRSPSFSREGESRTIMNSPAQKAAIVSSTLSKAGDLDISWPLVRGVDVPLVVGKGEEAATGDIPGGWGRSREGRIEGRKRLI